MLISEFQETCLQNGNWISVWAKKFHIGASITLLILAMLSLLCPIHFMVSQFQPVV